MKSYILRTLCRMLDDYNFDRFRENKDKYKITVLAFYLYKVYNQ